MGIVIQVGNDEREIRELVVVKVGGKLGKRDQVQLLHAAVDHIREISQRVVMADVRSCIPANVANRGQALCIALPGFSRRKHMTDNIVRCDCACVTVTIGDDLSRRHHEIVSDGGMSVGVILCKQHILRGQAIEVWHGGAAHDTGITVVFFYNDDYMT